MRQVMVNAAPLHKTKHIADSAALGRPFHADVIEPAAAPEPSVLMLFFGGSGVTREKYAARRETIIDVFDPVLASAQTNTAVRFVFVTAPYDVPYGRMTEGDEHAERWTAHVHEELLATWPRLPVFVGAYSGGALLACTGALDHARVFGFGAIGADGLRRDALVDHLGQRPLFVYNDRDRVLARNRAVAAAIGRLRVLESGAGHELAGYLDGFRLLLDVAVASAPVRGQRVPSSGS